MNWNKVDITTDQGDTVSAQAPVIVSASRSTDIPAFYADWFVARWKKGYVKWFNQFNGVHLYVSFKKTRAVVFWTKDPQPIMQHLDFLNESVKNFYFQFTLNDYEKEEFEKYVPSLAQRIKTFKELSNMVGKDRVIWRFDPLLLTTSLDVNELLMRVEAIGDELRAYTSKMVFSFADISIYKKVQNNLRIQGINYVEFTPDSMSAFAQRLSVLNRKWGFELATCAEKVDLSAFGISHNRCIDDDLMIKLFSNDGELMKFLGVKHHEPTLFGDSCEFVKTKKMKDKGQRELCGCIMSKDIGQYNTCPHGCVYCYANTSHEMAMQNSRCHALHPQHESIVGD